MPDIVDRIRSLVVASPFSYVEAPSPFDFLNTPNGLLDGAIRVTEAGSQRIRAEFMFGEERVDRLVIYVARKFAGDPTTARRTLARDAASLVTAITRYGEQTWGEFSVEAEGRQHEIRADQGAEFGVLQLTVPVNYETDV